jgi:glutamate dehydrogenase
VTNIGIDESYFKIESVETVASHIESLYGAKIQAHASQQDYVDIKLEKETEVSQYSPVRIDNLYRVDDKQR